MDKKSLILVVLLIVCVILLVEIKLTGFTVQEGESVEVIRLVTKNKTADLTQVKITIISSENVLAIQENLSSNCSVLDYSIVPEIDIFSFKPTETTWIIANSSENIEAEMFYTIDYDCEVLGGQYFILSGEGIESLDIEGNATTDNETTEPTQEPSAPSGGSSGGSSGGGGGGGGSSAKPVVLKTVSITQAEDEEEFKDLKEKATDVLRKISSQTETPWEVNKTTTILAGILVLVVIAIVVFLLISFTRRPK